MLKSFSKSFKVPKNIGIKNIYSINLEDAFLEITEPSSKWDKALSLQY